MIHNVVINLLLRGFRVSCFSRNNYTGRHVTNERQMTVRPYCDAFARVLGEITFK